MIDRMSVFTVLAMLTMFFVRSMTAFTSLPLARNYKRKK